MSASTPKYTCVQVRRKIHILESPRRHGFRIREWKIRYFTCSEPGFL